MTTKNISIRLDDEVIKKLRETGDIAKLSTKIHHILQHHISMEYTRESHWIPHPIYAYRLFFENMDEKQIDAYTNIMIKEYEKYALFSQSKFSDIDCLINFGNFVSSTGGLIKKISSNVDYFEYFIEHNLGLNPSKILYTFYLKISKLSDLFIYDEIIENTFVSFKLKKNNS